MLCCFFNGVKTSQLWRGGDKRIVDEPGRRRVVVLMLRLYGHHHRDGAIHASALACSARGGVWRVSPQVHVHRCSSGRSRDASAPANALGGRFAAGRMQCCRCLCRPRQHHQNAREMRSFCPSGLGQVTKSEKRRSVTGTSHRPGCHSGDNGLNHKSGSSALHTTAFHTRFVQACSRVPRPDAGPGRGKFGREMEPQLSSKGFQLLSPDCHPVTRCMW